MACLFSIFPWILDIPCWILDILSPVGKLNHNKAVESLVDWRQFRLDIEALFKELGISQDRYYIKADLRKA